ncbi:MAG: AroB-related putative sugar phosphate phospholyase (cyclizing) [bacterium]
MLTIKSHFHDYSVEEHASLKIALENIDGSKGTFFLIDGVVVRNYAEVFEGLVPEEKRIVIEASEEQKSFERLTPIFLELLERGLKRDGILVVIGGGVLQDIACFIATVLFRGVRWELIPTTLLAQADSCIGSKSSINIGTYKNQIGTFYPPHRVLLVNDVLRSLPWDEIRSGLGEVIKLQLIAGESGFNELMDDLQGVTPGGDLGVISKWVGRSMTVKTPYIEDDEMDRGIRNILNYGHTFGHAYESATKYTIPHGIAVLLGILTATHLSVRLGLVPASHYQDLQGRLSPWYHPYGDALLKADREAIFNAIRHDKKNTGDAVNCILTRGAGRMEKMKVEFLDDLVPAVDEFIQQKAF